MVNITQVDGLLPAPHASMSYLGVIETNSKNQLCGLSSEGDSGDTDENSQYCNPAVGHALALYMTHQAGDYPEKRPLCFPPLQLSYWLTTKKQ